MTHFHSSPAHITTTPHASAAARGEDARASAAAPDSAAQGAEPQGGKRRWRLRRSILTPQLTRRRDIASTGMGAFAGVVTVLFGCATTLLMALVVAHQFTPDYVYARATSIKFPEPVLVMLAAFTAVVVGAICLVSAARAVRDVLYALLLTAGVVFLGSGIGELFGFAYARAQGSFGEHSLKVSIDRTLGVPIDVAAPTLALGLALVALGFAIWRHRVVDRWRGERGPQWRALA